MKKIILIPANTDFNRGDQALVWESVRVIQDVYEKQNIEIKLIISSKKAIEKGAVKQTQKFLKLQYIDSILKHPNRFFLKHAEEKINYGLAGYVKFGIVSVFDFLRSIFLLFPIAFLNKIGLLFYPKEAKKAYLYFKESDAVFVKGGGFIHSYGSSSDFYRLYYVLFLLLIAIRFKKKIYILPNSIGPLKNIFAKRLVLFILKRCSLITVRESISRNFVAQDLSLPVKSFLDFGYYLEEEKNFDSELYLKNKIPMDKPIVGLTLRPDRTLLQGGNSDKYKNYINSFVDLVCFLNKKDYHVCFFAHTLGPSANENDELAIKAVIKALPQYADFSFVLDSNLSCKETMMLYSHCKFFVGTRFHSVIFSQNMGVPTIAISYGGNKGEGIMRDLGLSDYVIKMSEVSGDSLINMFKKLEENQISYKKILEQLKLTKYQSRSELISLIRHKEAL